jgi:hypothetical protein
MPFGMNAGCGPGLHRHASHDYCHPVDREHEGQGAPDQGEAGRGWTRDDVAQLLQRVGPDSGPDGLRRAAQQLMRTNDPGLRAVAHFLAEAGDALHFGRRGEAERLYRQALERAGSLSSRQQLSLRARVGKARRAADELAKDIGGAGAPMTGGMVSTPVAGGGRRRSRRGR